jgi:DNA-binding NarL/FixJ family response regulator
MPGPPVRSTQTTRVLIVDVGSALRDNGFDDHPSVTVMVVDTVAGALSATVQFKPRAIVLAMAQESPDECESARCLSKVARALVVVTPPADASRITRLLKAGATGYLFFGDARTRLWGAVHDALAGGVPMSAAVAQLVLERARRDSSSQMPAVRVDQIAAESLLSSRQREVLDLLSYGHSYEHIALALDVSVNTVRTHLRAIYERLGASTKVEAVLIARDLGLLGTVP